MAYDKVFRVDVAMPVKDGQGVDITFRSDKFPTGDEKKLIVEIMRRTAAYIEQHPDDPGPALSANEF